MWCVYVYVNMYSECKYVCKNVGDLYTVCVYVCEYEFMCVSVKMCLSM